MNASHISQHDALAVVQSAAAGLSAELGYPSLSTAAADTALFGGEEGVDSLSLVRIVAEVERLAGQRFGKRFVLADERAMSRRTSPFRTVGTLADLVLERFGEA
jgi:acyl carrier protein